MSRSQKIRDEMLPRLQQRYRALRSNRRAGSLHSAPHAAKAHPLPCRLLLNHKGGLSKNKKVEGNVLPDDENEGSWRPTVHPCGWGAFGKPGRSNQRETGVQFPPSATLGSAGKRAKLRVSLRAVGIVIYVEITESKCP